MQQNGHTMNIFVVGDTTLSGSRVREGGLREGGEGGKGRESKNERDLGGRREGRRNELNLKLRLRVEL